MNYELELLKIFGLENHSINKLDLSFEPNNLINLTAKILISDKHGEEVVTLLKQYKVKEIKEE